MKDEVEKLFKGWAAWCGTHGINLDYPGMTPFRKLTGTRAGREIISDSAAEEVDSIISELKGRYDRAREVAILVYIYGYYLHELKNFGITADQARMEKSFLIGYLASRLNIRI